jgi:hypothetical protein
MIHVQLYKFGQIYRESRVETVRLAERTIDQLITDVLQGRFGTGEFELAADLIDDFDTAISTHFACRFVHPAPSRAAVLKPVS